ncbi:polyamine-modulated factor 1 isoform X2 [Macaca fascicularis]|uniref:polyamine-modulated factor 1 isoform X2 n=1 Tax=Macaca fascicularis TaxID=9541 RepID=UPI0032B027E8
MAEASSANLGGGCEEKRHEGSSPQSVPPGTTISRVKLLDTMVDTFLQKLVAAGSLPHSPLLHWDGSAGPHLPSGGQPVKQAFRWAVTTGKEGELRTSHRQHWWSVCFTPALGPIRCQLPELKRDASSSDPPPANYQRFTDCYKRFYQLQPDITQRIYDKFIAQLQTSIREEISDIKEEGNLEAVLNALDKIVEEGKDRKEPAWRPSGIPEKDLHSVMAPYFLQQRDTLRRHVHKQEAENQQLADAVLAGRRQVEELQLQVQARQQAWQALHREQRELVAVLREPE